VGSSWYWKIFDDVDSVPCNPTSFGGDPAPGQYKSCLRVDQERPSDGFIGISNGNTFTLAYTGHDNLTPDSDLYYRCYIDKTYQPCSRSNVFSGVPGSHTYRMEVYDRKITVGGTSYVGFSNDFSATGTYSAWPSTINAWVPCATEGGTCSYSWKQVVRYGAGNSWNWGNFFDADCNAATFGDPDPNQANKTCQVGVTDWTPPNTIMDSILAEKSDSNATFTFSGKDGNGSGVAYFECSLDNQDYSVCSSPKTYTGLSEKEHVFAVRAVDRAELRDSTPSIHAWATSSSISVNKAVTCSSANISYGTTWNCDRAVDGNSELAGSKWLSNYGYDPEWIQVDLGDVYSINKVELVWEPAFRAQVYDIQVSNNNIVWRTIYSTDSGSGAKDTLTEFTANSTGRYIRMNLKQRVYNVYTGIGYSLFEFGVKGSLSTDDTPPVITIDTKPTDPSSSADASFSFSSTDDSGIDYYLCKLGSDWYEVCSSPKSYSNLGEGSHTFKVSAVDNAGNSSPFTDYTWVISKSIARNKPTTCSSVYTYPYECSRVVDGNSATQWVSWPEDTHWLQVDLGATYSITEAVLEWGNSTRASSYEIQVSNDASAWVTISDATPSSGATDTLTLNGAGRYIRLYATQPTDSISLFEFSVKGSIPSETTPPDVPTISAQPANPSGSGNASFTFSATDSGANASGINYYECKLDNGAYAVCASPKAYSGLADDSHSFRVRAVDKAGNIGQPSIAYTWTIDITAPNGTVSGQADGTSFTLTFSGSDNLTPTPDLTYQCQSDGGGFSTCANPKTYTNLSIGAHVFDMRVYDALGNNRTFTFNATIVSNPDTQAPTGSVSATVNGTFSTLTFTGSDNITPFGSLTYQCQVDGGGFFACTNPKTYAGLSEGPHTVAMQVYDAAGNSATFENNITVTPLPGNIASWTQCGYEYDTCSFSGQRYVRYGADNSWYYGEFTGSVQCSYLLFGDPIYGTVKTCEYGNPDTTMPAPTTLVQKPNAITNNTSATFEFSTNDNLTTPENMTYTCSFDGGPWQPCTNPVTFDNLTEDQHHIWYYATDQAGNDNFSEVYIWKIDTTPPGETTLVKTPNALSNSASATFEFSTNDDVTASGDMAYVCSLDNADWQVCTNPVTFDGLTEGPHDIWFYAQDQAGNNNYADAGVHYYSWSIDTTPPSNTTLVQKPNPVTSETSATFEFSSTDNVTATGDIAYVCYLEPVGWQDCTNPMTFDNLAEGWHKIWIYAVDQAGNDNYANMASFEWAVDTTPPGEISLAQKPYAMSADSSATFEFSTTDNITASENIAYTCGLDGADWQDCTNPVTFDNMTEGQHYIWYYATDQAGNNNYDDAYTHDYSWTTDITPPDPTTFVQTPNAVSNSTSATFEFSTIDNVTAPQDIIYTCYLDDSGWQDCANPVTFDNLADGRHELWVVGWDEARNNYTSEAYYGWTVNTAPPAPVIYTRPSAFMFASQDAGTTSAFRSFLVANIGNADLVIGTLSTTDDFILGTDNCSGATLAQYDSCSYEVAFSPTSAGDKTGSVSILHNGADSPTAIDLFGTGLTPPATAPAININVTSWDFSSQTIGTTSAAVPFTVTNSGSADLVLGALSINGGEFTFSANTCNNATLAPAATCAFDVTFSPTSLGTQSGVLSIPHNAAGSSTQAALTGTGIAPTYCAPFAYSGYEYISRVQLGTGDNASLGGNYQDFTTFNLTDLPLGSSNLAQITAQIDGPEYAKAWVDFNHDLDFDDAGEELILGPYLGSGTYTFSANLAVPSGATLGATRMRVILAYNVIPGPCYTDWFGEVEDYTVSITAPTSSYTVTFDAQGGSPTPAIQTVAYGALVTAPAAPAKTGYTFNGWFTAASGGTQWNFATSTMGAADMTLYAQWVSTNTAPTNILLSASAVLENKPAATLVGHLTATDTAGDTSAFSLVTGVAGCASTNNASFQIVAKQLKTKAVFNFEVKNSYVICIRVTDGGGLTFNKAFTIKVTNVIEEQAKNGGFETYAGISKIPTGWTQVGFGTLDGKNTGFKTGKYAVKIANTTAKTKTLTQTLPILTGASGQKFTFSYWVKDTTLPTAGLCQGQVLLYNSANKLVKTVTLPCGKIGTFAYTFRTISFTTTAAYTKAVIKFTYSKAKSSVWFDVVSLKK
jgi:uncharacterized repeat protein (TIGR02543 family)